MLVIVLGHTGFIGKNAAAALKQSGHEVVGLSLSTGCDLTDLNSLRGHLSKIHPDAILNFAAHVGSVHYGIKYPAEIVHKNMLMSLNLYRTVAEICPDVRLVNPVSNCSYPHQAEIQRESEWWDGWPHDSALPYASTRRMTYVLAVSYKQQYNISSKNFVLPGVYGPGDHTDTERVHALDGMIIRMIEAKRQKLPEFEIWGTGHPVREWCYVDDVVQVMMKGLTTEEDLTYPVNIGQKQGYTIAQSAEMIAEAVRYEGRLVFNTAYADGAAIKVLDNQRFRELFPDFVFHDMKQGIINTVEYYKSIL